MLLSSRLKVFSSGLLLLIWVSAATAAPPSVSVIFSADNDFYQRVFESFTATLTRLNYDASRLKVFVQHPHPDYYSWANSARRAVATGNQALITLGAAATRVALRETSSQQVIFAALVTPIDAQLDDLPKLSPRDRDQASGATCQLPVATLIKSYVEIMRGRSIGAVFLDNDPEQDYQLHLLEQAASIYGITVQKILLSPKDLELSLQQASNGVDALYLSAGAFDKGALAALFSAAARLHLPVLGAAPGYASRGALASIEVDTQEQGEWLARRLVAILEDKAGPEVFKPHPVDLVINLKTAESLGLKVPFETLTAATKIIR